MIPIMIITESGRGYNYFDNQAEIETMLVLNYNTAQNIFRSSEKVPKVLELLHKEVAECYYKTYDNNQLYEIRQTKFQIYLKDIIKKAEEELK